MARSHQAIKGLDGPDPPLLLLLLLLVRLLELALP